MDIKLLLISHLLVLVHQGHLCCSSLITNENSVTGPKIIENIKANNGFNKKSKCSKFIYKEKIYERISNDWLHDEIYTLPSDQAFCRKRDVSSTSSKPSFEQWTEKAKYAYFRTQMWTFPAHALIAFTSGHLKLTCIFISMCMSGISLLKFLEFMVYPSEDTPTVTFWMILPTYVVCTILVSTELLIAMSADNFLANLESTNMFNRKPRLVKFAKYVYKFVIPVSCILVFYVANLTFIAAYINDLQDTEPNIHVTQRFCIDKILDDIRPFIFLAPLDILLFSSAYLLFKANWLNLGDF